MIYLNVAGLAPFNPQVQQEVDRIHQDFSQLLYSEQGIAFYRQILNQSRRDIAAWFGGTDPSQIAFIPNGHNGKLVSPLSDDLDAKRCHRYHHP